MRLLIFIFCFIIFSTPSRAGDFLPQSFQAQFEQVIVSSLSGKEKKSFGKIQYQHPGKVHFLVERPQPSEFVSNLKKSWFYTPPFSSREKGEVVVQNSSLVLSRFFDALTQGLVSNATYETSCIKLICTIKFNAKLAKELGMDRTNLIFKKEKSRLFSEINSIHLNYKDKAPVILIFSNLEINKKFSEETFIFKIPPNTNVTQG